MVVTTLLDRDTDIRKCTVADGTAINKGTIIVLSSDPNTGKAHSAEDEIPLGILVEDKVANDGQTEVGIRVRGDVDVECDGAVTLGDWVKLGADANSVKVSSGDSLSGSDLGRLFGIALETGSDNEVIRVRMRLG